MGILWYKRLGCADAPLSSNTRRDSKPSSDRHTSFVNVKVDLPVPLLSAETFWFSSSATGSYHSDHCPHVKRTSTAFLSFLSSWALSMCGAYFELRSLLNFPEVMFLDVFMAHSFFPLSLSFIFFLRILLTSNGTTLHTPWLLKKMRFDLFLSYPVGSKRGGYSHPLSLSELTFMFTPSPSWAQTSFTLH